LLSIRLWLKKLPDLYRTRGYTSTREDETILSITLSGKAKRSVVSFRLSVSKILFEPTDLLLIFACVRVITIAHRGSKVEVIGQDQRWMQNVCYTAVSCEYGLTAVVVGFHFNVISCHSAAMPTAESSACGRGNAVGLTSILDRGSFLSS